MELDARERVGEVAFVGLDEPEGLVAVSTVYSKRSARLGMDLWHYRAFIARDHRRGALAIKLTARIKDHFEALYVSGRDRGGGGVVVVIENDILKHVKNEAVWPYVPYVFIGENAKGDHVRVIYFPGAVAPAPS